MYLSEYVFETLPLPSPPTPPLAMIETELITLGQWEDKFKKQYPIVGYLKGATKPVCQIDVW